MFEKFHSDDKIKNILNIRKTFKENDLIYIEDNFKKEKEIFIHHYDDLFENGASEFPGILEFYTLLKPKILKPNTGQGFLFEMSKEDAIIYGKNIVKYFLVKNSNIVPLHYRTKISLDAYFELLALSNVDKDFIEKSKENYYKKYNFKNNY